MEKTLGSKKRMLPEFPRTKHLPFMANAVEGDIVAADAEVSVIFETDRLYIEEKIDGANSGIMLYEGHPIIRNRNHILNKGYLKDTPAKMQFRPLWGWFYENKKRFAQLNDAVGFEVSVYGEWCYALHGIRYDKLPDLFVAYDLYDHATDKFIATDKARELLVTAGFSVPPLLHTGKVQSWEQLEALCNEPSAFSTTDKREGLYVKISDGKYLTDRYKMVRSDFVQGCNWNIREITRNKLVS